MIGTTSLLIANSAPAQSITGTQYLSVNPTAIYPSWNDANTTITSISTGLEVANIGDAEGGALYYALAPSQIQTLNENDAIATLTVTINGGNQSGYVWGGMTLILDDSAGNSQSFNVYSGDGNPGNPSYVTWSGNTLTENLSLDSTLLADIQAGGDSINGITLGYYPATLTTPGGTYDITYNSIDLSPAAVPEPAPLALTGLGAFGFWLLRRRK